MRLPHLTRRQTRASTPHHQPQSHPTALPAQATWNLLHLLRKVRTPRTPPLSACRTPPRNLPHRPIELPPPIRTRTPSLELPWSSTHTMTLTFTEPLEPPIFMEPHLRNQPQQRHHPNT